MIAFCSALSRRKRNNDDHNSGGDGDNKTQLARVLTLFDLTALGVGSTLGLGVYVLAGSVAYGQAGPAVVLSFLFAAIASAFAAISYAEFAARVPRAGSAYVYSYVTVGEFVAFTIGWNLILEYVIGTSSVARGLSGYIDALFNKTMENYLTETMPLKASFLGSYPDFLAFFFVALLAALLAFGAKESSYLNNAFTVVNMATIGVCLVAGSLKANPANWNIPKESIPAGINGGVGGFMPFGMTGVMAGAAKCFYGFVGFDCVATTGEEAKNPKRNIPLSIVISLIIITLAYLGVSSVLTLLWPYYLQDPNAPFPHAFNEVGWPAVGLVVSIGAIFALCTSLLGAMFPLPRVLYAMASDGLLFGRLKTINARTQTPLLATLVAGTLSGVMALLFNLIQLVDMMSIGTLLAYTIVTVSVVVLRYECDETARRLEMPSTFAVVGGPTVRTLFAQLLNVNGVKQPTRLSSIIVKCSIVLFGFVTMLLCSIVNVMQFQTGFDDPVMQMAAACVGAGLLAIVLVIWRQPTAETDITFKLPLVPWVPCLSVMINLYLMFQLDMHTWIRFSVWGAIGYAIYFGYGMRHSQEGQQRSREQSTATATTPRTQCELVVKFPTLSLDTGTYKKRSDSDP